MLADKITMADMQADNKAVTDPIVKAAALSCYQAMKAEALHLYIQGNILTRDADQARARGLRRRLCELSQDRQHEADQRLQPTARRSS